MKNIPKVILLLVLFESTVGAQADMFPGEMNRAFRRMNSVTGRFVVDGSLSATDVPASSSNNFFASSLPDGGVLPRMLSEHSEAPVNSPGKRSLEFAREDSVQYVSTAGSDSNDGLSPGEAKLTITAAYAALPSCAIVHFYYVGDAYNDLTWPHCGTINLAGESFTISSVISFYSPHLKLQGSNTGATVLNCRVVNGPCIYWTGQPSPHASYFGAEFYSGGGLFDVRIDGYGAGAGSYGLQTDDFSGFHAERDAIMNFTAKGSVGWLDSATHYWNEKDRVQMSLYNNKVNWQIAVAPTAPGYPYTTFGYGAFDITFGDYDGQVGLQMLDGTLSYSMLHMTFNQPDNPANADAIDVFNNASAQEDVYAIEIESPEGVGSGHELNLTSSSGAPIAGVGTITQTYPTSNAGSAWAVGTNGTHYYPPQSSQYWPSFRTPDTNTRGPNTLFRVNACPIGGGLTGCDVTDFMQVPSTKYSQIMLPSGLSGTLAFSGANGVSAGSTTLRDGSGSHLFTNAYAATPVCYAWDATNSAHTFTYSCTAKGLTFSGGVGADVIDWIAVTPVN
jgi:hypothetical protein